MKFTLLIATLNRPKELRICVERLLAQTYTDYEIIIVDQSSDKQINASIAKMSPTIKYIQISEKGLSHARNVGLKYAKGDYICLVDDDSFFEYDTLEIAANELVKNPVAILCGKIIDPITQIAFPQKPSGYVQWGTVFQYCMSASMMIKRQLFEYQLFDESLGVGAKFGSGEETDIVMFALSKGEKVYSCNFAIYHKINDIKPSTEAEIQKRLAYSYGYGALCKKIVLQYSRFWGMYYFSRTFLGNVVRGYLLAILFDKADNLYRRRRAQKVLQGFQNYRSRF